MSDPDMLRSIGQALYGEHWVMPLAHELGVAERTVRRWNGGQFSVPPGIWPELENLCAERIAALESVRLHLRTRPRPKATSTPASTLE